ncbi:Sec-independent protein translocase protein TatB [Rubrobacter calidifluminis]|uniref:Sec-independent protein translocase protein TatB n=1 Tax=Rubrobacter calidifluminis TaxID=1392640 RepID=UPI002361C593|nr:Sec-independent protein translocase protein TatB [Rubrobacter calidifluminis]
MGFGIGFQEMLIIGVIVLVLFGPNKLPQMARDLGRFVNEARQSIDEIKEELTAESEDGTLEQDEDFEDPYGGRADQVEADAGEEDEDYEPPRERAGRTGASFPEGESRTPREGDTGQSSS